MVESWGRERRVSCGVRSIAHRLPRPPLACCSWEIYQKPLLQFYEASVWAAGWLKSLR